MRAPEGYPSAGMLPVRMLSSSPSRRTFEIAHAAHLLGRGADVHGRYARLPQEARSRETGRIDVVPRANVAGSGPQHSVLQALDVHVAAQLGPGAQRVRMQSRDQASHVDPLHVVIAHDDASRGVAPGDEMERSLVADALVTLRRRDACLVEHPASDAVDPARAGVVERTSLEDDHAHARTRRMKRQRCPRATGPHDRQIYIRHSAVAAFITPRARIPMSAATATASSAIRVIWLFVCAVSCLRSARRLSILMSLAPAIASLVSSMW